MSTAAASPVLKASSIGAITVPRRLWWRVYAHEFSPTLCNPTAAGNARFSPLRNVVGSIVPTLYAATSPAAALMETVLHDAPSPCEGFILTLPALAHEPRRMACLVNLQPLVLADFSALGLRRMGLRRSDVLDCDKPGYGATRALAEQVYALRPDVQGIQWTSRQDDRAQALVLFGTRVPHDALCAWHEGDVLTEGAMLDELLDLLERLGAGIWLG